MPIITELQQKIHEWANRKGWWEDSPKKTRHKDWVFITSKLALVSSEISEAIEELRNGNMNVYYADESPKPEGFGVELADAVIRILDIAESVGMDLETLIQLKMDYNETRGHKHGKLF